MFLSESRSWVTLVSVASLPLTEQAIIFENGGFLSSTIATVSPNPLHSNSTLHMPLLAALTRRTADGQVELSAYPAWGPLKSPKPPSKHLPSPASLQTDRILASS